jgi:uncharacterized membrane protein
VAQTSPSGARRTPGRLGRRFTRRHRRLRVGLSQLLFVVAGLVLGIFVPKTTVPPTVSSGRIVDLLFTAGVTVISLITVIYSLLFVVVQWVGSAFSLRLSLFRDDPIVWRAFAYSIGVFVFCFTAAFAIGNRKTVSVVVPVLALALVLAALVFMRTLQTRALVSMLLAPNLDAITERGREILDGLYLQPAAGDSAPGAPLPPLRSTVTWPDRPAVLQQLHLGPLVTAARAAGSVVVLRQAVGVTLLSGMPVADVHGGDLGQQAVLRAIVPGRERTFDQDPLLAFRLLADIALRALSPAINDPATAVQVLDCLEGLLAPLAARSATAGQVTDAGGVIRVMLNLPHWDDFARSCLDDIIAASADSPMVLLRTRDLLTRLSPTAPGSGQKVLASRLRWVEDTLARNLPVVWADAASARDGQPAPDPPPAPGRLG